MFEFSLVMVPVITLLIPIIALTVYCYVKDQGWKAVLWGCLSMIVTIYLVRMVLPLMVLNTEWFVSLMANPVPYSAVYSLCFSIVYLLLSWLSLRFLVKPKTPEQGLTFGFCQGMAYVGMFISFPALSALLSDINVTIGTAGSAGLWFSIAEAVMIELYLAIGGWMIEKFILEKKYGYLVGAFVLFGLVLEWGLLASILVFSRIWGLLVLFVGLVALICGFRSKLPLKTLFTQDENE